MSNPEAPSSGRLGAARAPLSVLPAAAAIVLAAILVTAAGVRLGAQPSATPVFDWLFDDPVKATARVGNTLFVGGSFSKVVPQTGRVGTLVGLAPTTGTLVTAYPPYGDVIVPSPMALDGAGGYYAATETDVNGTFVRDIVHVRSDGSRDPAFTLGAIVKRGTYDQYPKITVVPSALIVTGSLQVGGVDRAIAAFDRATGAALPWAAVLPMSAFAVAQVASPARFFVLSYVTGAPTSDLHAFDLATGATVWHQTLAPGSLGAMTLAGGRLIVGIAFNPLRAIDAGTGTVDPAWGATVTGHIFGDIVLSGTAIYASIDREPFGIKVDLASGTIVPWPATLNRFTRLAPSPTGGVFVNGPLVVGGQTRAGPVEIDAAGVATAWTPAIPGKVAGVLDSGELAVERDALQGLVVRPGLAAFDLTTGTLSSIAPVLGGPYIYIDQVLSDGQRVFFKGTFTSVNGQPRNGVAAIDGTTGALLDWPAPGVELSELAATDASHVYIYTAGALLRRLDSSTGVLDPTWLPPVKGFVAFDGSQIVVAGSFSFGQPGTFVGTLDGTTGSYREAFRTNAFAVGAQPVVDGHTVYLPGQVSPPIIYPDGFAATSVLAVDRTAGLPVLGPQVAGFFNTLTKAGGRMVVGGAMVTVGGQYAYGAVEIARPGRTTTWDSGFRRHSGDLRGITTWTQGDLLVAAGTIGRLSGAGAYEDYTRVAAFPFTAGAAPSNLRLQLIGPNTVFTWDAMVPSPAGGYVIEGGFGAGQTAGALAVGNATSVALPMPAGPAFIRVRPQGSTEVSNEIVAGCVAPPLPPTALSTTLNGANLSLAWTAPAGAVMAYSFSAGTAAGSSNVATVALPGTQASIGGTVPSGTFFARVTATNACGTSGPSGEVFFTIGAPDPLPAAPTNLAVTVSGSTVSLTWTSPSGPVTGYVLEGGTAEGLANIGTIQLGAVTSFAIPGAPSGAYALRVRAITSAGSGAPSADVVAVVP